MARNPTKLSEEKALLYVTDQIKDFIRRLSDDGVGSSSSSTLCYDDKGKPADDGISTSWRDSCRFVREQEFQIATKMLGLIAQHSSALANSSLP